MQDRLAKKKLRRGIRFIVVGLGLLSIFPVMLLITTSLSNDTGFGYFFLMLYLSYSFLIFSILGLILIVIGIITIIKRNRLSNKEKAESRIENLEEKLDEVNDSENS